MSELKSAFATNFAPLGADAACEIKIEHVTKTTKQDGMRLPPCFKNNENSDHILRIEIPNIYSHYEIMVATDKQGVVLRCTIENSSTPRNVYDVELKAEDNFAFVNVRIFHPERREVVRFMPLLQTNAPPNKYQGVLDLLQLVEGRLQTKPQFSCSNPDSASFPPKPSTFSSYRRADNL